MNTVEVVLLVVLSVEDLDVKGGGGGVGGGVA